MASITEHDVAYDGNKVVHYLAAGPHLGPLMIFMHGWPGIAKTWKAQINTFASLGFRVIAPDMPGYGKSTAQKVQSDYAQEQIIKGMLALLADNGRSQAIWVAHDWGCGTLWTLAATHPEVCIAVCGMAVPYRVIELGLEEAVKYVNREIYPIDKYPWGQWEYQAFYEQSFDAATAEFNADIRYALTLFFARASPQALGRPAMTATTVRDNGWFVAREKRLKAAGADKAPADNVSLDKEIFEELVAAMEETGFYPGNAWYMNHKANRKFNIEHAKNEAVLQMPVLFIEAKYDAVCDTASSRLSEPMRRLCKNLTEVSIDAGHHVAVEKPAETNAALARWLVESVKENWPGFWKYGHVKNKL